MGVVFLAEQQEPISRQAALKIIKPGMDTAKVIKDGRREEWSGMVIRKRFLTAVVVLTCLLGVVWTWNRVSAAAGDQALRHDAPGTVVGIIGPCLRNVQDGSDGFLAVPNRPGHRIRDPWKTLATSVQHLEYPVPASMQYMAYSSSTGGVAVHVLDPGMVYKQLAFGGPGRQMTFIQIGAAWSVLCFDKSHGHRTPATAWAEGYSALLRQLRSAVRNVNPDFFCWVEGAWEGAAQYVDLSQGGFWPDHPGSEPFPELYHYTLPEHPLFGDARLGGVPYWCPSDISRTRRINAQASSFFWNGEFRDTLDLSIDQGGEAHWFREGSQALITVFNPHDGTREFTVRLGGMLVNQNGQCLTAMSLTSGTATQVTLDGNCIRLNVTVPSHQVEAVLVRGD
ncbi:MAG: hypothetical protein ACYC3X_21970 [Pirellulaceae bacterium]